MNSVLLQEDLIGKKHSWGWMEEKKILNRVFFFIASPIRIEMVEESAANFVSLSPNISPPLVFGHKSSS